MRIAYTPEQERLRRELRGYFGRADDAGGPRGARVVEPAPAGDGDYGDGAAYRGGGPAARRDGWLALSWPGEYGGRGGTMIDQLIFTDEAANGGVRCRS